MAVPPSPQLYFAYGSNLNRADMRVRCPAALPIMPAFLAGWRLTFRGVADIEPAQRRIVYGALWSLSTQDVRGLDRYEGVPDHYRRLTVTVDTSSGPADAIAYVMTDGDYLGLPSDWYLGRIEQGFGDWGLPLAELKRSLAETQASLDQLGVIHYRPDGRKRLRALL